ELRVLIATRGGADRVGALAQVEALLEAVGRARTRRRRPRGLLAHLDPALLGRVLEAPLDVRAAAWLRLRPRRQQGAQRQQAAQRPQSDWSAAGLLPGARRTSRRTEVRADRARPRTRGRACTRVRAR